VDRPCSAAVRLEGQVQLPSVNGSCSTAESSQKQVRAASVDAPAVLQDVSSKAGAIAMSRALLLQEMSIETGVEAVNRSGQILVNRSTELAVIRFQLSPPRASKTAPR
jgi:hypothetical protein